MKLAHLIKTAIFAPSNSKLIDWMPLLLATVVTAPMAKEFFYVPQFLILLHFLGFLCLFGVAIKNKESFPKILSLATFMRGIKVMSALALAFIPLCIVPALHLYDTVALSVAGIYAVLAFITVFLACVYNYPDYTILQVGRFMKTHIIKVISFLLWTCIIAFITADCLMLMTHMMNTSGKGQLDWVVYALFCFIVILYFVFVWAAAAGLICQDEKQEVAQ